MAYGEFDAIIDRVLAGPRVETQISLSSQGGKTDEVVTEIGRYSQSVWSNDGSFSGFIISDTQSPTCSVPSLLPVVDGRVVFPDEVSCFEPVGLRDADKRSVSVLVFDNGTVIASSGLFQTASLDKITQEARYVTHPL